MTINAFIAIFKKLLSRNKSFQLVIDCKNDGTIKLGSLKGEELLNDLLTDEKE